ncbi:hypothetical protein [Aquimarina sp. 2201CG5-10]|uniref:AbiJ-related protein n=1 Tax=Aquimarina callyspongiae TaxID=3098150 RepID=UPI002AB46462|nr:hypothetical protein [Aquimarina sp. 2201CG5-10]MDY8136909.1 hypothetical protein [Aquimarina sp. 2201CG5-10]
MIKLSKNLKSDIAKEIFNENTLFGKTTTYDGIMEFLELILDLRKMPSENPHFIDAYDDIYNYLTNLEWDYNDLFIGRLRIFEDDDKFVKLLNISISPKFRNDEDDIMNFYYLLEPYLENENLFFDNSKPLSYLQFISGIRYVSGRLTAMEYGDNI